MNDQAVVAKKGPFGVVVEKGKTYWWCACGRSQSQPFCDGSHKGTDFEPLKYVADDDVMVAFCGCKRSRHKPHCDDTHISITEQPTYQAMELQSCTNVTTMYQAQSIASFHARILKAGLKPVISQ